MLDVMSMTILTSEPYSATVDLEILKVAKTFEGDERDTFISRFEEKERKSSIGILLALVLGGFGAHAFYLDQQKKGIWYLVITIVGFCTVAIVIGAIALLVITVLCIIDAVNMGPSEIDGFVG